MIEARMRGILDFRDADPLDKRWWFKLRLALDHIEDIKNAEQSRLYYDYNLAILSRNNLTDASNKQFIKDAEKRIFDIVNIWRPWDQHDPNQNQQTQIESLTKQWTAVYGDPNDPKTKQAIAETVRLMNKMDVRGRIGTNAPTVL